MNTGSLQDDITTDPLLDGIIIDPLQEDEIIIEILQDEISELSAEHYARRQEREKEEQDSFKQIQNLCKNIEPKLVGIFKQILAFFLFKGFTAHIELLKDTTIIKYSDFKATEIIDHYGKVDIAFIKDLLEDSFLLPTVEYDYSIRDAEIDSKYDMIEKLDSCDIIMHIHCLDDIKATVIRDFNDFEEKYAKIMSNYANLIKNFHTIVHSTIQKVALERYKNWHNLNETELILKEGEKSYHNILKNLTIKIHKHTSGTQSVNDDTLSASSQTARDFLGERKTFIGDGIRDFIVDYLDNNPCTSLINYQDRLIFSQDFEGSKNIYEIYLTDCIFSLWLSGKKTVQNSCIRRSTF
jgi:hypothetical protein